MHLARSAWANIHPAYAPRIARTTNFASARYAELLDRVSAETNDQNLKAVVRELTQIMLDEAFVIPFSEDLGTSGIDVARRAVRSITSDVWGMYNYQDMWLNA